MKTLGKCFWNSSNDEAPDLSEASPVVVLWPCVAVNLTVLMLSLDFRRNGLHFVMMLNPTRFSQTSQLRTGATAGPLNTQSVLGVSRQM